SASRITPEPVLPPRTPRTSIDTTDGCTARATSAKFGTAAVPPPVAPRSAVAGGVLAAGLEAATGRVPPPLRPVATYAPVMPPPTATATRARPTPSFCLPVRPPRGGGGTISLPAKSYIRASPSPAEGGRNVTPNDPSPPLEPDPA